MEMVSFTLIYAATRKGGIGKDGKLPWPLLREEMKRFRNTTTAPEGKQSVIIMGAKTWASLPTKPLPKRVNVVLSSQTREALGLPEGVQLCRTFDEALTFAATIPNLHDVFAIGGARVYEEAQRHPKCARVCATEILAPDFPCDVYFKFDASRFIMKPSPWVEYDTHAGTWYQYVNYLAIETPKHTLPLPEETKFVNTEERQYLDLVSDIIKTGVQKSDRTGVGTLSKFGCMAKYDLRDGKIPLLTTKRVFWRGVVEELIWMINGRTGAKELQAKGVKIWDGNGTKVFLEGIGQGHREEFDLGPIYGHQWRHFGAPYMDCHTDYKDQGVDQLTELITLIKKSPDSRRILMSAWNPTQLKEMALPPCHVLCQFYVAPSPTSGPNELNCIMYQRSCDMGLGVPFNIASYSLLTHLLAHICGLRPGTFTHMMGDTHVYLNHVEPLKVQVARAPTAFPTIRFKRDIIAIEGFSFADVELMGYTPQLPDIKMEMAV